MECGKCGKCGTLVPRRGAMTVHTEGGISRFAGNCICAIQCGVQGEGGGEVGEELGWKEKGAGVRGEASKMHRWRMSCWRGKQRRRCKTGKQEGDNRTWSSPTGASLT